VVAIIATVRAASAATSMPCGRSRRGGSYSVRQFGGGRGIRTPGGSDTTAVFKTAPINRSGIPPRGRAAVYGVADTVATILSSNGSCWLSKLSEAVAEYGCPFPHAPGPPAGPAPSMKNHRLSR
jgi:hypothetical protein